MHGETVKFGKSKTCVCQVQRRWRTLWNI